MKLERVLLKRLRSVNFATLEECGPFNVLIGKNNCGKSTLLSAINTFFACVADGQMVALSPPFGAAIDFHRRDTGTPIEIELWFSLTLAERDALVRSVALEAPQLKNAIDGLDPSLLLSASLSITSQPVSFGYVSRLALVTCDESQAPRILFAVGPMSASELQLKYRNLRRAKMDSEKLTDALRNFDEDDFRRVRESSGGSIPRGYLLRGVGDASATVVQTIETMFRESTTYSEFKRSTKAAAAKMIEESQASYSEPLKNPVSTFSGEEAEIPKYVQTILQSLAELKVLYLSEHRKPLGKDEAQQLLELKVRRGGNEALINIQNTVHALLGVRIDAFESGTPTPRGKTAEMDVDDFLLEVNGSGIREALRLVLDYEFKHPNVLLVEEPEVHLHPALEIAMMRYLKQISQRCQVFLSTHSTNFLDGGDMINIYLVSKADETKIQLLNLEDAQARIPKELGLRLSSLFMFDRLVFVEGPSDEAVLREFAGKLDVNLAQQNVGFIPIGGVRNFTHYATEAILSFLAKRQVDIWFVLDHDENDLADMDRIKERLKGRASLHILRKRELENYLLRPRAIGALLGEKLRTSGRAGADISPAAISELIDECAEALKGFSLLKRVAKHLCKPVFVASKFESQLREGEVGPAIAVKLDEQAKELTERQNSLQDTITRETAELELNWPNSKQEIVPGPELLDLVCQKFGVRFRKEADSHRLAALLTREEIDAELRELLQSLSK
jgi:putative ATP-dependent endonuclease of OLD family